MKLLKYFLPLLFVSSLFAASDTTVTVDTAIVIKIKKQITISVLDKDTSVVKAKVDSSKAKEDTTKLISHKDNKTIQQNFMDALTVTGEGMAGILLFMLLFFFITKALDKIFPQPIERSK